jgi:hypothetical protein
MKVFMGSPKQPMGNMPFYVWLLGFNLVALTVVCLVFVLAFSGGRDEEILLPPKYGGFFEGDDPARSAARFSKSRSQVEAMLLEQLRSGESRRDIVDSREWNTQRLLLVRSVVGGEEQLRAIEQDSAMTPSEKARRTNEFIATQSLLQLIKLEKQVAEAKAAVDTENAARAFAAEVKNTADAMNQSVQKSREISKQGERDIQGMKDAARGKARVRP